MTLSVICWRWGKLFSTLYVERLRNMLARHLHIPHQLYCVTDDPAPIPGVVTVAMPTEFADTPRCLRRMWQFAKERVADFGPRMLCIDLDVVIVRDITPIVDRSAPIVCWRVGYADVYSGSFMLLNTGALDGAWRAYSADPEGFPKRTGEKNASDQACLNYWLSVSGTKAAEWTERDGFASWFGSGYERLEHRGMGPTRNALLPGTRIVVLGSADKRVLDEAQFPFVREHWR